MLRTWLQTAARVPAALVWAIIFLLRWCETRFIHPAAAWFVDDVTAAWEEGAKSLVREGFAAATRGANGATAWLLSLLVDRRYWRTLRAEGARSRRGAAWEAYWREARPSTLNAVVARAVGGKSDGSEPGTRGSSTSPPPRPPPAVTFADARGGLGSPSPSAVPPLATGPKPAGPLPAARRAAGRALAGGAAAAAAALSRARTYVAGEPGPPVPVSASHVIGPGGGLTPAAGSAASLADVALAVGGGGGAGGPSTNRLRRNGSDLFERGAWNTGAEAGAVKRRGLLEDARLGLEEGLATAFDGLRRAVRFVLFMPRPPEPIDAAAVAAAEAAEVCTPRAAAAAAAAAAVAAAAAASVPTAPPPPPPAEPDEDDWEALAARPRAARFRRSKSFVAGGGLDAPSSAAEYSTAAFFDAEEHTVTTSDGYVLRVTRLPRTRENGEPSREVALFVHGILDTPVSWVSSGVAGSLGFAAWLDGSDVWLANSRANPPCAHVDDALFARAAAAAARGGGSGAPAPSRPPPRACDGWRYWRYSVNEMALEDVGAIVDHIHVIKMAEFAAAAAKKKGGKGGSGGGSGVPGPPPPPPPAHPPATVAREGFRRQAAADVAGPRSRACASDSEAVDGPGAGRRAGGGGGGGRTRADPAAAAAAAALRPPNEASIREAMAGQEEDDQPTTRTPVRAVLVGALAAATRRGGGSGRGGGGGDESDSPPPSRPSVSETGALPPPRRRHPRHRWVGPAASAPPGAEGVEEEEEEDGGDGAESGPAAPRAGPSLPPRPPPARGGAGSGAATPDPSASTSAQTDAKPYRLRAVGHSMGGAALLIYAVMCRSLGRPHRLDRLVLLTPAGFQDRPPLAAYPFIVAVPLICRALDLLSPVLLRPGSRWNPGGGGGGGGGGGTAFPAGAGPPLAGARFHLPTSPLRHVTFKLTHDLQHLPAVQELVRTFIRVCFSGDTSQWDRALQLPHYAAAAMPGISFHTGNHICQWIKSGKFQLYDYGGPAGAGNLARYGVRSPPDIAARYGLLDVPVDIVAGRADGVIVAENCRRHYDAMVAAGRGPWTSYREFPDTGHMDFVVAAKDDVRSYLLSLLKRAGGAHGPGGGGGSG